MADPLLIQTLQNTVNDLQDRIASYQAAINDPEASSVRKQVAQRNLDNANAKLAVAQDKLATAKAQNEPAKNVVTDTDVPPATSPVVTQATPQQLDLSSPESSPTLNPPASEAVTNTTATNTDTPEIDENIPGYGTAPLTAPPIGADDPASQLAQADAAAHASENENIPPVDSTLAQSLTRSLSGTQSTSLVTETPDWRVRISLAGGSYLYNAAKDESNILYPLKATSGVIFPYTPTIQTAYRANYEGSDLTHANYKQWFYKNSSVEEITITGEFTVQDNTEAKYLLAVIHFFKSVTKMFYGQDTNPAPGTPPPLCFLNGYGPYQFNDHPILISNFQYSLPNDVDYVRTVGTALGNASASTSSIATGTKTPSLLDQASSFGNSILNRLKGNNLQKGGISPQPTFNNLASPAATYVPSKISITITAIPIVTRNDISKNFSVSDYASGKLLLGNTRNPKGGIW
jgi:hypothetical protein